MNKIKWRPIEEFDKDNMHRIPVLLHDPDWYCGIWPKSNIAQGYHDSHLGWYISLFEACSCYAWVTYHSDRFKPKYFAEIPDFSYPTVD